MRHNPVYATVHSTSLLEGAVARPSSTGDVYDLNEDYDESSQMLESLAGGGGGGGGAGRGRGGGGGGGGGGGLESWTGEIGSGGCFGWPSRVALARGAPTTPTQTAHDTTPTQQREKETSGSVTCFKAALQSQDTQHNSQAHDDAASRHATNGDVKEHLQRSKEARRGWCVGVCSSEKEECALLSV
jgi:hypothetical protein